MGSSNMMENWINDYKRLSLKKKLLGGVLAASYLLPISSSSPKVYSAPLPEKYKGHITGYGDSGEWMYNTTHRGNVKNFDDAVNSINLDKWHNHLTKSNKFNPSHGNYDPMADYRLEITLNHPSILAEIKDNKAREKYFKMKKLYDEYRNQFKNDKTENM